MKPSAIRRELLDQHLELRVAMQAARRAAERCARSGNPAELRDALAHIGDRLRMHNLHEEELMRDVFPTLDAWGMIRAEVMVEEHVLEHRQLYEALLGASSTLDAKAAAAKANELFDKILAHMAREEKVFLGEDVLSDDDITPDSFGG